MAHTTHTATRTSDERLARISATRHRDHSVRRTGTRAAVIAAALAEYRGDI